MAGPNYVRLQTIHKWGCYSVSCVVCAAVQSIIYEQRIKKNSVFVYAEKYFIRNIQSGERKWTENLNINKNSNSYR